VFGVITGLFWYGIWVVVACAAFLAVSGASAEKLRLWAPVGALGVCVYWQVMPILSASMGSALDMRKLMVYPVPHAKLFQVEVLLRLTTGVEMLMVLAGSVAGMFHRAALMGWLSLPAVLLYIAFNLLLASGTRSGYSFVYAPSDPSDAGEYQSYTVHASPLKPGITGRNYFYLDQTAILRFKPDGPADATSATVPK